MNTPENRVTLNLKQAKELLAMFEEEDSLISIAYIRPTREQPFIPIGLYAWFTEIPEEGYFYLNDGQ